MDIKEAIKERHSVRQYKDLPIAEDLVLKLKEKIIQTNAESGMHFQLITGDPDCFDTFLAHYGKFTNANNYIAVVGKKSFDDLEERAGYFGQKLVIEAQMLGLNTCWAAGSFGRGKCRAEVSRDEKLICVIAIGYGENSGKKHKSKKLSKLCDVPEVEMPTWFRNGMIAAMMAPTAINLQKFFVTLDGEEPVITAKSGPMTKIDLGIVKYNFEAASGHKCRSENGESAKDS